MITAPTSSLTLVSRSAPSDSIVAQQLAASLVSLHPALANPSSDFATEVGIAAGDISSMFTARFGARDTSAQQIALASVMRGLLAAHDKTDSLGDLSQDQANKLQAAMNRLAPFAKTLSNILKAISDTESGIIGNMK